MAQIWMLTPAPLRLWKSLPMNLVDKRLDKATAPRLLWVNRFSNRPFRVKRFQTNQHHSGVDVAHGLVLLFGIGTRPLYGAFLVKRFK